MVVISDASPLNVLIRIEYAHVLPALFHNVVIPPAVAQELSRHETPLVVRDWLSSLPIWLKIQSPAVVDPNIAGDLGEREAICLSRELNADLLLVDDLKARTSAKRLGLRTTGTLGVLELASHANLISLPEAIEKLRRTDFRISEKLLLAALERNYQRKTQ